MIDLNIIRENPGEYQKQAARKGFKVDALRILSLDKSGRELLIQVEALRFEKNRLAKEIGMLPKEERANASTQGKKIKSELELLEPKLKEITESLDELLLTCPSVPLPEVPDGVSDAENVEVRRVGQIPQFDYTPKDHMALARSLDLVEFERAHSFAGSRSYLLKNYGALLEHALTRYVIDCLMAKGFTYYQVPLLVKDSAMIGTGFFPLGRDETFRLERDELNLIGTSEVSLVSTRAGEIFEEAELPVRLVGYSNCFRREAGSYGKDTKGLYRVHQFTKVEQVVFCKASAEAAEAEHEFILHNAEEIMQALELPYRVALACAGEIGLGQVKKHEIETWMPSRNAYSETHSCSTLNDFQARRLKIRYRDNSGKLQFVYTLNNTAIAVPRLLIPLLENNQLKDGSVKIPAVLSPYLNGLNVLTPKPTP
jgi:seryl-tRNA synthetase